MTHDEIVALAKAMRAAGVSKFSYGDLQCELLPPEPKPMDEIRERIEEMPPQERMRLLDAAKKDLDKDLYGASG